MMKKRKFRNFPVFIFFQIIFLFSCQPLVLIDIPDGHTKEMPTAMKKPGKDSQPSSEKSQVNCGKEICRFFPKQEAFFIEFDITFFSEFFAISIFSSFKQFGAIF